jgi:hypothetical protein
MGRFVQIQASGGDTTQSRERGYEHREGGGGERKREYL